MTGDLPLLGIIGGGVGARGNGWIMAGRSSLDLGLPRTRYAFRLGFRAFFDLKGFQNLNDMASPSNTLFGSLLLLRRDLEPSDPPGVPAW